MQYSFMSVAQIVMSTCQKGINPADGNCYKVLHTNLHVITFCKCVSQTIIECVHVSEVTQAKINTTQTLTRKKKMEVSVYSSCVIRNKM